MLVVPAGWSAPSLTGANAGYTTSNCGTVAVASQTITITAVTLAGAANCTIVYGSTASAGPGATATGTTGAQTWQAQEKSTAGGTLTNLGTSPSITINSAADGSGTLTTPTANVVANSTRNTVVFTYTAATGGTSSGTITLVVPVGWSAPSLTGANVGFTTSTCGTAAVASQTITITAVTLGAAATCTITYGSTASGGIGATATGTTGAQTWQAQEKSTAGGTLTNLGTSPSITIVLGTLSVSAPGPVTLSPNPAPGTSSGPYALGSLSFTNTLFDGGIWNVTMTATDFYDSGSSKIGIPFTNLTINVDQAPSPQAGAFGTVTPGAATQTLTGTDGIPGTTPSNPITLASAAAGNAAQGTWTTANTLSIVTPGNSTQHTYLSTVQYTITG